MADHQTLAEALAAFQAEVPRMSKDETAKVTGKNGETGNKVSYTYGYAGLDQFVEIVEPVLGKHGLSVTGVTTWTDGQFMAEVSLLHESGEKLTSHWPLPDPRRFGPQDIGSALTYARRYLGWLMTGTFPGGIDDDGKQAQQAQRDSWETASPVRQAFDQHKRGVNADKPVSAPPAQQQVKTSWSDDEVLKLVTPLPTAPVAKAISVYDWMASKDLHKRSVGMDWNGKSVSVTATDLLAGRIADAAMDETLSVFDVKKLRTESHDRGLLKVQVSETETLDDALRTAEELAQHAAAVEAAGGSAGQD